ncbi:glycosyl transferase family 1 [Aliiruegeria haliotis]|uniref:Glycosyl transferase family 1 n=1 Tax=Aliiruegeria haliotis TaxID=1280846 RepID=A0A2T0RNH8_9RHOB|nr:glycosyltransferase [Aliiruegeria haliotis]PRY22708.1 glycosyl transferase family 1 [Aliiruegeria haliotis]
MRLLYIIRDRSGRSVVKKLHRWSIGFVDGQEGFFEASLHQACDVTRRTWAEVQAMPRDRLKRFDAVVVNGKSGVPWRGDTADARVFDMFPQPVSLFIGNAQPEIMGEDPVLDRFKVIFKREPFADLERYAISEANRAKIVPTHLSNPMATMSWRMPARNRVRPLKRYAWDMPKVLDVFFIGTVQNTPEIPRQDVWAKIVAAEGVNAVGGILPKTGHDVPPDLLTEQIGRDQYREIMLQTKVNLALEGMGPFTFRHLELFWAGAFALSTPSIRPLRLRAPLVEDQDYVSFDTLDEMVDKIRYYAANDEARTQIARNGRAAYERLHDVDAHSVEIREALEA